MKDFLNLLDTLLEINEYEKTKEDNEFYNKLKSLELKTDKGLKEYNDLLDNLKESDYSGILGNLVDELKEIGLSIHNKFKDIEKEQKSTEIDRNLIDHSEGEDFKLPSELLSIDKKLTLHKIVQEYIDTMIKPYNKGVLTNKQINDAYAGLYEFGAWVLNR